MLSQLEPPPRRTFVVGSMSKIKPVEGEDRHRIAEGFLSVRNQGDFCILLGQGVCYPFHLRDNGEAERNFWSGFVKVECQPLANSMVFIVDDICRKVILYPSDDNLLTVVNYMRQFKNLPYTVIVPVFPEVGDICFFKVNPMKTFGMDTFKMLILLTRPWMFTFMSHF